MSKHLRAAARPRLWLAAMMLAVALMALPMLVPALPTSLADILAQPVSAGCPIGGSCG